MMFGRRDNDVLVLGAGPVGLFTALSLAERGVRVQVLDKDMRTAVHSYALALHAGTLRLLDELGLADALVEEGQRVEKMAFYRGERRLGELDFSAFGGRFPFLLVVPQSKLETALERQLKKKKVKVWWNHRATAVSPDLEGVTSEIARLDRVSLGYPVAKLAWVITKTFNLRTRFLVGADGYHSFTRKSLGAEYVEHGGPQVFDVFEFAAPRPLENEVRVAFSEDTTNVLWPLTGQRGRWSFQVAREPGSEPDPDRLAEFIRTRAPWFGPAPSEVFWTTSVQFEQRLSDVFGKGRVWLAGDAAHLTGPVGAQSMNVGLREGRDLADAIARCLENGPGLDPLEAYGKQRTGEWRTLLGLEDRPAPGRDTPDWAKELVADVLPCLPASGEDLAALLAQMGFETT